VPVGRSLVELDVRARRAFAGKQTWRIHSRYFRRPWTLMWFGEWGFSPR